MIHDLKTDPLMFVPVVSGEKSYEIRKDDRGVEVGHILRLRETVYTGEEMAAGRARLLYSNREICVVVTHILRGPAYGIKDGWAIFSTRHVFHERNGEMK